ncbi:ProQ/FinO family protein [Halomonas sp. 7T]|uniref:ProQ/FinO family protein n=1 Tax=Halomonas sp. 7T TaxID=2893469 RepID=UPI0021DB7F1F|nr:ProQ/FinO family protein [Halomonas sp. 7T]UXZ53002.1 ProQ/FinO family protein [Halomonas sp. 7T]
MAANVLHLIETLEAHLERTETELKALREENTWLKQQLAAQNKPHDVAPAPEESLEMLGNAPQKNEKTEAEVEMVEDGRDDAKETEAPSPQALLNQWYQRYPNAFFKGHTKPLKIGIHHDLAQREPWSGKLIRRALANYVNLPRYVKSMREGAERFDLDGNPAGKVDKEASLHASQRRKERPSSGASVATKKSKLPQKNTANAADHAPTHTPKKKAETGSHVSRPVVKADDKSKHPAQPETSGLESGLEKSHQAKPLSLEEKLKGLQQKFKGH